MAEKTEKTEVIERAKKNLTRMVKLMSKAHEVGKRCMEFVGGEQWEDGDIKDRLATKRPMITINKLSNFVNIVVNKNSQERSRIKALPFEDSDVDTARVVNGLIRHIQYSDKSDAGEAYSNAFFDLVTMGFGYWRVDTEFVDDMSVDEQEIVINKIDDPLSVFLDPDGNFAIVVKFIPKDIFEEKYGEHKDGDWGIIGLKGDDPEDVMMVEYWEKTETNVEIFKIEIPEQVVDGAPVAEIDAAIELSLNPEQAEPTKSKTITVTEDELKDYPDAVVIKQRKSKKSVVKQYLFAGNDELESSDWAGKYLPIIGVYGRKFKTRNGEIFFKPLVFDAIDPQKYYNYLKSQDFELMRMAPKNPWIGAEGQFTGHEDEFSNSNTDNVPYVEYKAITVDGQVVPSPQRTSPPPVNAAFYQNIMQSNDEIKACIGMYDASLGATSNETSGKAILARGRQGDVATHHFTQASNVALRQTGLVIVDLRPHIYDSARTIRILGDDMKDEVVKINQPFVDPKTGKTVTYDMTQGKYDIKIDIGSNSMTRRLDAAENLLEFARVVPKAGEIGADFIAGNLDFEYADELSKRLKAAQNPALLDRVKQLEQNENGGPTPEQIQMQKMAQAVQGMQQQLGQAQQAIQVMAKENQMLKSKVSQADVIIARIKADSEIKKEQIESAASVEVARINSGSQNIPIPAQEVAPAGNRNNMAMQNHSNGGPQ
ncbi:MAG: portal protein [Candidatus Marinimicrobia bacterium]|nr:portal protein [Candidatus Neomarinimicrobiota bacterium]